MREAKRGGTKEEDGIIYRKEKAKLCKKVKKASEK